MGNGSGGCGGGKGMGKKRRATQTSGVDKPTGIIKRVAITPPAVVVLGVALPAVACAPLGPHPWSPRVSLVFSISNVKVQTSVHIHINEVNMYCYIKFKLNLLLMNISALMLSPYLIETLVYLI